MSGNSINFDDRKIKKSDFYNNKNKKIFNISNVDVNKILVSKKENYDKYNSLNTLFGYSNNDIIRPLYLELPQIPVILINLMRIKAKIKIKTQ